MIDVVVSYGETHVRFSRAWVSRVLKYVLNKECVRSMIVGVRFVNDDEMTIHNRRYRKKNRPTDVLSFAYEDDMADIIIDVDYVRRVIQKSGGRMQDQVGMLLVHGMLHALGYTHGTRKEARSMWEKQDMYAHALRVERISFADFG